MADVLISASAADKTQAEHLGQMFIDRGFSVDWMNLDPAQPGNRAALRARRASARVTIALWSAASVRDALVIEDAREGLRRGSLLAARLDDAQPAPEFKSAPIANLAGWDGSFSNIEAGRLFTETVRILDRTATRPALSAVAAKLVRASGGGGVYSQPVYNSQKAFESDAPPSAMAPVMSRSEAATAPAPVNTNTRSTLANVSAQPSSDAAQSAAIAAASSAPAISAPVANAPATTEPLADAAPMPPKPASGTGIELTPVTTASANKSDGELKLNPINAEFLAANDAFIVQEVKQPPLEAKNALERAPVDSASAAPKPAAEQAAPERISRARRDEIFTSRIVPPPAERVSRSAANRKNKSKRGAAKSDATRQPFLRQSPPRTRQDDIKGAFAWAGGLAASALLLGVWFNSRPEDFGVRAPAPQQPRIEQMATARAPEAPVVTTQDTQDAAAPVSVTDPATQESGHDSGMARGLAPVSAPPSTQSPAVTAQAVAPKPTLTTNARTQDFASGLPALGTAPAIPGTRAGATKQPAEAMATTKSAVAPTVPVAPPVKVATVAPAALPKPAPVIVAASAPPQPSVVAVEPKPITVAPKPAPVVIAATPKPAAPASIKSTAPAPVKMAAAMPNKSIAPPKKAAPQPRLGASPKTIATPRQLESKFAFKTTAPRPIKQQPVEKTPTEKAPTVASVNPLPAIQDHAPGIITQAPAGLSAERLASVGASLDKAATAPPKTIQDLAKADAAPPPQVSAPVVVAPVFAAFDETPSLTVLQLGAETFHLPDLTPSELAGWRPDASAPASAAIEADWNVEQARVLAQSALLEGSYEQHLERAKLGEPKAMLTLGLMRQTGIGTALNENIAYAWLRRAALKKDPRALAELGAYYASGRGGPLRDDARGARLFARSAATGSAAGQTALGWALTAGRGVDADAVKARTLFEAAANKGNALAALNLGRLNADGLGGAVDPQAAIKWYSKAADQGFAPAQYALAVMLLRESQNPTGNPSAASALSPPSEDNPAPASDGPLYALRLQQAAAQGYPEAQRLLGALYANGVGVPKDQGIAQSWYDRAKGKIASLQRPIKLAVLHAGGSR